MNCMELVRLRYVALFAVVSFVFLGSTAYAATGDYVSTVFFSENCSSGVGVGLTYDGSNLWYSCTHSGTDGTDLYRADPATGLVTASYDIVETGGLGALSYDATRNVIWAGEGIGGPGGEPVYKIELDAGKNVVNSSLAFDVAGMVSPCSLNDGLAFDARDVADGTDDVIYYSNDCSTQVINVFDLSGNFVENFTWAGTSHYNSGLAVGGQLLYQGSDGASHVWVVDKANKSLVFDFPTNVVANDPNFRDEDLACDTDTFVGYGKHVMWSKEAYNPMRAHAFEIPFGSCGVGGEPPAEPPVVACVETVNPSGKNVPPAGSTTLPGPKGGQNEDGFYELLAKDVMDPSPEVFVMDSASGVVFGPFLSGTKIKYTEANGAVPSQKAMAGPKSAIDFHIKGQGDAIVFAVNAAGLKSDPVSCLVAPLPK